MKIDLFDGKYTYICDDIGRQIVLRYGESWRSLSGDKFVHAMACRIIELETRLNAIATSKPTS